MIKLTPQQEEEVRLAWNKNVSPSPIIYHEVLGQESWKWAIDNLSYVAGFRLGYIAAKGWDKEGEK